MVIKDITIELVLAWMKVNLIEKDVKVNRNHYINGTYIDNAITNHLGNFQKLMFDLKIF